MHRTHPRVGRKPRIGLACSRKHCACGLHRAASRAGARARSLRLRRRGGPIEKKKWYQKLIQIIIIVILIVAAVITAGAALAAAGMAAPGLLAAGASLFAATGIAAGGVVAFAAAAAIGAGVYAAASILTQGLAVAADLQDSFSWKAVGKAAISGAISGAAGFLGSSTAVTQFFGNSQVAARVAVEVGKQLVVDGKISNVAGVVGAAAAGGAFKELGADGSALRAAGDWIGNNTATFSSGLSMLESKVRGRGDNAMQWVGLATSALFDSGALNADGAGTSSDVANRATTPQYFDKAGNLNWKAVAVQVVGAAIVGDRMGEDAALGYLGNAVGEFVVQAGGRYYDGLQAEKREAQAELLRESRRGAPAASGPASPSAAALTPAQQAAMAAGYGPVTADKAEQLAQQGLLSQPRAQAQAGEQANTAQTPEELRAAFRKSETDYRNSTSAVVQKGDTVIEIAQRLYGEDWRAGVAVIAASNNLKTDRYGNPIIHEGQELNVLPLNGASSEQLEQLGRAGGALVAGNTRRSNEVRTADTLRAQALEQQRIADLYASAGPRGGAGVAYGDAPRASTMSADTNADMFSNLGPEFGGSSGVEAERSPLLSRAAGAVELIAGGAWNSVVRIAGGVASVSFLLD